jgi:hypothetical protein
MWRSDMPRLNDDGVTLELSFGLVYKQVFAHPIFCG